MAWHVIAGLSSHQVKDENNEEIEVQDAVMAPPVAVVMVWWFELAVSKNSGTPKSSILIGFSLINHPFWGTPIFGNTQLIFGIQDYPI